MATSGEWVAYHVTILFAVLLFVQCLFLPETLYPRAAILAQESQKYGVAIISIAPTSSESSKSNFFVSCPWRLQYCCFHSDIFYLQNIKKIPGVPHPKVWTTTIQFFNLFRYPTIVISVLGYCFLQYWWYVPFTVNHHENTTHRPAGSAASPPSSQTPTSTTPPAPKAFS